MTFGEAVLNPQNQPLHQPLWLSKMEIESHLTKKEKE
jgi:hypothetical protein